MNTGRFFAPVLDGIADQIEQELMKLNAICHDNGQRIPGIVA
jgi:hypothetical protein